MKTYQPDRFAIELDQTDDRDIYASDSDNKTLCPTWFYPKSQRNGSTVCVCGSELGETIRCNNKTHVVSWIKQMIETSMLVTLITKHSVLPGSIPSPKEMAAQCACVVVNLVKQ